MTDRKNSQEEIRKVFVALTEDAQKLVQAIIKIERQHQHKGRPTGIADEIVKTIKGLVK